MEDEAERKGWEEVWGIKTEWVFMKENSEIEPKFLRCFSECSVKSDLLDTNH